MNNDSRKITYGVHMDYCGYINSHLAGIKHSDLD